MLAGVPKNLSIVIISPFCSSTARTVVKIEPEQKIGDITEALLGKYPFLTTGGEAHSLFLPGGTADGSGVGQWLDDNKTFADYQYSVRVSAAVCESLNRHCVARHGRV
jgi:non-ribosomal peptide synthetase component E (peptide arylation enzyme)